jgi:DNA-binding HxlR family transcriptional regulator
MRSYGQFCAAARALDVIGDRWSLLVVRELLLRDCRFTDLRRGLPGIATNLLADRLRDLEAAGVLERVEAAPPVATALYRLTPRGRALEPVLRELLRWGVAEMVRGAGEDAVCGHWVAGALPVLYDGARLGDLAPLRVAIDAGGEPLALEVPRRGPVVTSLGTPEQADVHVTGPTEQVLAAFAGRDEALDELEVQGDADRLRELVTRATIELPA